MAGRDGSTLAPSPSSTSSKAGSTLEPPGAKRPRISLTASTASMSASTASSSQAAAAAGSDGAVARAGVDAGVKVAGEVGPGLADRLAERVTDPIEEPAA